ncbi:Type-1 restriction enzyme EcoBI specificity protein [Marine Group I thaumarchaeote SCGC AAA799-P11]|uniref:Type-1 restriction enzyme EcoBI specificity protein n=1 Tax=Marine Group I thaumarchaeote SCGC AAA799-P11 TaxID=1502295 RepID=A0A087RXZ3_9ARCH|nr:Type-1 restriction enzyme EcoBI specificity protein [Marine Group I thaumarchaeote SCGC AAA799-P11]
MEKNESLPKGWINTTFEKCVEILDGKRIPINSKERQQRQGKIPYYGATGQVGWIDDYLFDEQLVLLGEDGVPFFNNFKNKAYLISGKSWVNNHAHVLKGISNLLLNDFLCYYLNQIDYHNYVNGTTRLKLNQTSMKKIPIILPPLNEQKRIVEKIEMFYSIIDSFYSTILENKMKLELYQKSFLISILEGKMIEYEKTDLENNTLEKITQSRFLLFEKEIKKNPKKKIQKPPQPIEITENKFYDCPTDWQWTTLNSIIDPYRGITYGVIKLGQDIENGIPCLRTSDVKSLKIETHGVKKISKNIADEYKRTYLRGGEVLVNVRGTLGGVCSVPNTLKDYNISREVAMVPVLSIIPSDWVSYWISSVASQNWLTGATKGIAYRGINLEDLRNLPICIPPLKLIPKLISKIEYNFSIIKQFGIYLDLDKSVAKMRSKILQFAFEGKLVPQDPNDEPASELLKKITLP